MIYGTVTGSIYTQKKSLEYIDFSDLYFYKWNALTQTIPKIIGRGVIEWTSPNVLVEWEDD